VVLYQSRSDQSALVLLALQHESLPELAVTVVAMPTCAFKI
jgi:hypothetical protein